MTTYRYLGCVRNRYVGPELAGTWSLPGFPKLNQAVKICKGRGKSYASSLVLARTALQLLVYSPPPSITKTSEDMHWLTPLEYIE